MLLKSGIIQLILCIITVHVVAAQQCEQRNATAAGRSCERPCREDGTCRKASRECVCHDLCGASCLKRCPSIMNFAHGHISIAPLSRTVGAIVTYTCHNRYNLVGNVNRTCQSNNEWTGSQPVCEDSAVVYCTMLDAPDNGQVTYDPETRTSGTVATYRCDTGYTLTGNQEHTCQQNGSWSSGLPVTCSQGEECVTNEVEISRQNRRCIKSCTSHDDCRRERQCVCDDICGFSCIPQGRENYCPELRIRGHNFTMTISRSWKFGSIVNYQCRRNYESVRGDAQRRCLGNGDWSGSPTVCLPKGRCGQPPVVPNAHPSQDKEYYEPNDHVDYNCEPGYYRGTARSRITCYERNWTEPNFQCHRKSCGDPGYVLNGRRIGNSFLLLDTVRYQCDLGYGIVGTEMRFCQIDQSWTRTLPRCEAVICPALLNPQHGRKIGFDFSYDSEVAFRCDTGYYLEGSSEVRCQANGSWTALPPTCISV